MPMTDMSPEELSRAIGAIEWAHDDPDAQAVDLDLVLELRRLVRKRTPLDNDAWNAAWRIAAQLVTKGAAKQRTAGVLEALREGRSILPAPARRLSVYQEPLVLQAQRELEAVAFSSSPLG